MIVNKLKHCLPEIIGPMQSSFIPGRHITDNIIVAQEVIHSMRNKKGKGGLMAIKVDLEKAYDMLRWEFIHETLIDVRLPSDLINVTMRCISSPSMQLLWNGEHTDSFLPSRGIRQGDSISPYLFMLCIEHLAHGIQQVVTDGEWKLINLGRSGPPLAHLFFADDMFLFSYTWSKLWLFKMFLEFFVIALGLKLAMPRQMCYFSKNVSSAQASNIATVLGFNVTKNL